MGHIMQLKPSNYLRLAKLPKITCGIAAGIRSQSSAPWVNCCRARFLGQQQHVHKIWDMDLRPMKISFYSTGLSFRFHLPIELACD